MGAVAWVLWTCLWISGGVLLVLASRAVWIAGSMLRARKARHRNSAVLRGPWPGEGWPIGSREDVREAMAALHHPVDSARRARQDREIRERTGRLASWPMMTVPGEITVLSRSLNPPLPVVSREAHRPGCPEDRRIPVTASAPGLGPFHVADICGGCGAQIIDPGWLNPPDCGVYPDS